MRILIQFVLTIIGIFVMRCAIDFKRDKNSKLLMFTKEWWISILLTCLSAIILQASGKII
jgi:hypothetical protein